MKRIISIYFLLISFNVFAAGPESVALSDRSLWPDTINSAHEFDRASRAEILAFASALQEIGSQNEEDFKVIARIKSADMQSLTRIRDRLLDTALANFRIANKTCSSGDLMCGAVGSREELISTSHAVLGSLPTRYKPWFDDARSFHRKYVVELLRLAALFPKTTSEIDTFSTDERSGYELPDRHFLLTFDDGPSNVKGNSDALLPILRERGLHGMFYVLGERLNARSQVEDAAALKDLYQGQCIALHGWQHQSHQHWDQWQSSVINTQALVKQVFGDKYRPYFRPPYGQRRDDSGAFFKSNGLSVALWNIDSQDWNAKVTADQAANRVMTLMLLWRRGVVLFHDIHPKAQVAVPWLLAQNKTTGIIWDDCHSY